MRYNDIMKELLTIKRMLYEIESKIAAIEASCSSCRKGSSDDISYKVTQYVERLNKTFGDRWKGDNPAPAELIKFLIENGGEDDIIDALDNPQRVRNPKAYLYSKYIRITKSRSSENEDG